MTEQPGAEPPLVCAYCGSTIKAGAPFCTVCQSPISPPVEAMPHHPAPTGTGPRAPRQVVGYATGSPVEKSRWKKGASTLGPRTKVVITVVLLAWFVVAWRVWAEVPLVRVLVVTTMCPVIVVALLFIWRKDTVQEDEPGPSDDTDGPDNTYGLS